MFDTDASKLPEIVLRVALIYAGLLVLMRLAGRRTMSDVMPMDIMVMLLVSETVSPALTAGDESLTAGFVAAGTLIGLSVAVSWVVFRNRTAERVLSGSPALLIRDGHVDGAVMRRYRITNEDLEMALHQKGLLAVAQVRRAFVEADGEITVIKADESS
jgi:uncharacterized membrane protein YcaP (DUF421 family)